MIQGRHCDEFRVNNVGEY
jgi:hypothetical protein